MNVIRLEDGGVMLTETGGSFKDENQDEPVVTYGYAWGFFKQSFEEVREIYRQKRKKDDEELLTILSMIL